MNAMKEITFAAYDTFCTIRMLEPGGVDAFLVLDQAKALALAVQNTLNMFDPNSELSRLCASYTPGRPVRLSRMLYHFIKLNLEFSRQTDGAFDFTVGPLVKLWNVLADHPAIPSGWELEQARQKVSYQQIHLCDRRQEVIFDTAGMVLDPGASGKGYALELVADYLKTKGVKQGVLDFGGNLFVLGHKSLAEGRKEPWSVGIRHPDREQCLGSVRLADRGIATSSWYEHSFQKEGTVYHHLLNPSTGKPQEMDISSVSVLSSRAVYTDLLSTAFFVMGLEAGCALAKRLEDSRGIDVDYVALKKDGSLAASEGAGFTAGRQRGAC